MHQRRAPHGNFVGHNRPAQNRGTTELELQQQSGRRACGLLHGGGQVREQRQQAGRRGWPRRRAAQRGEQRVQAVLQQRQRLGSARVRRVLETIDVCLSFFPLQYIDILSNGKAYWPKRSKFYASFGIDFRRNYVCKQKAKHDSPKATQSYSAGL